MKMRQERRKGVCISTKGTYISLAFKNLYKLIFFFFAQENGSLWKSQVNTEERACPHPTCENLDFSTTVIDISFMTPTLICSVL